MAIITEEELPYWVQTTNLKWWILSLPPYWCENDTPTGTQAASDEVLMGNGMYRPLGYGVGSPAFTRKTNGLKYTYTQDAFDQGSLNYTNGAGSLAPWIPANKPSNSPYMPEQYGYAPNFYQQTKVSAGVWAIGGSKNGLFFGPYELDKTTDNTPYPNADGDIIIITTGSLVLGGTIGDGQLPYSAGDERVFNLLFYSTGSSDADLLSQKIPGITDPGKYLSTYDPTERGNYMFYNGFTAFVSIPVVNEGVPTGNYKWWPFTYKFHDATNIYSLNDC